MSLCLTNNTYPGYLSSILPVYLVNPQFNLIDPLIKAILHLPEPSLILPLFLSPLCRLILTTTLYNFLAHFLALFLYVFI